MSVRAMDWVWRHSRARGTARLVLLALADQCDERGACFPSVGHLARKCMIGERTVQAALRTLVASGEVAQDYRRGRSTLYRINLTPAESAPPGVQNPHPSPPQNPHPHQTEGGADLAPPGVQNLRPPPNGGVQISHPGGADPAPITVTDLSTSPTPVVREGRDKRGTRLPDDWKPSPALRAWTETQAPAAARDTEVDRFCDYWHAQPGARGRKADWDATWRNWARRVQDEQPRVNGRRTNPNPNSAENRLQRGREIAARLAAKEAQAGADAVLLALPAIGELP